MSIAVQTITLPVLITFALIVLAACGVILLRVRQQVRASSQQHDRLMQTLASRRDELEAAMASMLQGVIAVDTAGRLLSANHAAVQLLGINPHRHVGQPMERIVASVALRRFVERCLASPEPLQDDVALTVDEEILMFAAQGSALRHTDGRRVGSLIVLHDVTRLRRLEVVRQEFVTNASHEIRTPVAAIKMAAEMLEGNGAGPVDPEAVQRFIRIITRQADRLQALIDDLLSLTRIEQDTEQRRIRLQPRPVIEVLQSAAETCQPGATPRGSQIQVQCPAELVVPIHPPLLEQAVVNLLENAIKYSAEGSTVKCAAEVRDGEVILSVTDQGLGIAPEHLERIFERFYRTDRARSRDLGGTGLGLSIVKHVALAHGGHVSVDSRVGHGSTFRIHLPAPEHGHGSRDGGTSCP